jgi:hypothetical protein
VTTLTDSSSAVSVDAALVDDFRAATFAAFEEAFRRTDGASELGLDLAGASVVVRFSAPALAARFRPALEHIRCEPPPAPDLRIACWDRVVTGVAPPPPPWGAPDFLTGGRIRGHVYGDVRVWYDAWLQELHLYDRDRGQALFHVADAHRVPSWADRAPFRRLLTWWAADRGLVLLHAATVATDAGAVALVGPQGAGKSTTGMTCVARGFAFLGDDCCLVDPETADAFSVYARAKLESDALARLGEIPGAITDVGGGQLLVEPAAVQRRAPLRAVVLTEVTGGARSAVTPVEPRAALRALVAVTLAETGGTGTEFLAPLASLIRRLPVFRLELGTDPDEVASAVHEIVDRPT